MFNPNIKAPGRALTVLVVDDCHDTTASFALLLQLWGHVPLRAHGRGEALLRCAANVPDAVLLDIAMPGMSGWELAPRLRSLPGMAGALIVAVSGLTMPEDRLRSIGAGCDLHLAKPVPPAVLRRTLARLLDPDGDDGFEGKRDGAWN